MPLTSHPQSLDCPPALDTHLPPLPVLPAALLPWTPLRERPLLSSGRRVGRATDSPTQSSSFPQSPTLCGGNHPLLNPLLGQQADLSPQGTWVKEEPFVALAGAWLESGCGPGWGHSGAGGPGCLEAGSSTGTDPGDPSSSY